MELHVVTVEKPEEVNVILGQAHFIKTIEDIYEAIVQTNPAMRFGAAFCEASGPALVRWIGNEDSLVTLARDNALRIAAGHSFFIAIDNGFPVNILNAIKAIPEVARIFCATANPLQVIVGETEQGRGILGVVDGVPPRGVETEADIQTRKTFLRAIGYKL